MSARRTGPGRAWLVAALSVTLVSTASASPGAVPIVDTLGDGVRVELLGGQLHPFEHRDVYVSTAELEPELVLSPGVAVMATLPLAAVERDGAVSAGWGNVGAGVRLRSVSATGHATWTRTLIVHVAAPTASDGGGPGLAARSAAELHAALDLGDYMPGTFSTRVNASLRWQDARWWFAGALVHRLHLFTFDRGETDYWQPLRLTVGAGYRPSAAWTVAAIVDTSSDVLEARSGEGDHFRHVLRLGCARTFALGQLEAALLLPLDVEARDDQSPMVSLGLRRAIGD